MTDVALQFENLKVTFPIKGGLVDALMGKQRFFDAVDDVAFEINEGDIVGIVGESGSGKTTLSKAALGLAPVSSGNILLNGNPVNRSMLQDGQLQMVFQDPLSSMNPRHTVHNAIAIPLKLSRSCERSEIDERIDRLLEEVGLPVAFKERYPHELSGGQLQRVAIARALATNPKVLFADEAVSKLDVSVRAQILNLLKRIQKKNKLTVIFVTHDLHVARFLCNKIAVMYFGKLVEFGNMSEIYSSPGHPYTKQLLATLEKDHTKISLEAGEPFNPKTDNAGGCRFVKRCPLAVPICSDQSPSAFTHSSTHRTYCHQLLAENELAKS